MTSTELEARSYVEAPLGAVEDHQSKAVARLAEWATSADAAYKVAQRLVQSSFVPAQFRGKDVEATAAILAGLEVGLQPMAALRAFDIIQGQAAARALTLRAIAQSHGHSIEVQESTNTRCVVRAKRRNGDWQRVIWTIDRARELGLVGKDNWKKQPAAMLVARATSEAARLVAADAILGLGYSAEEVADGVGESIAVDASPQQLSGQRVAVGRRKPPAPRQEAPPEAEAEGTVQQPGDGITQAQMRALQASFRDQGVTDRDVRLEIVRSLIGRQVDSANDLTKAEASTVIDALKHDGVEPAEPSEEDEA